MTESRNGVGLATVLVAIFVTLKLTDVIDWSWFWIFSPWIITAVIVAFACAVIIIVDR